MTVIKCRAKLSKSCQDGQGCLGVYGEDSMADDGTFDGETVVCTPCYIKGGQPALYAGDAPTRQQVVQHVNREMGL